MSYFICFDTFSATNLSEDFTDYIERARSWHQTTVEAQVIVVRN